MVFFFLLMIRLPLISTLFPYTTLFRSRVPDARLAGDRLRDRVRARPARAPASLADRADHAGHRDPLHAPEDRKSTRLNSSHSQISYAVFCLKKKKKLSHLSFLARQIDR